MKFSRQQSEIIEELLRGHVLTSSGWARKTGSTKLTSRISELRAKGIDVRSAWSDELNQNKYWMLESEIEWIKDLISLR